MKTLTGISLSSSVIISFKQLELQAKCFFSIFDLILPVVMAVIIADLSHLSLTDF